MTEAIARSAWYCVLTKNKRWIVYAKCFVYIGTPIGHRVIREIDKKYHRDKHWSCITTGREGQIGNELRLVPSGTLLFGFYNGDDDETVRAPKCKESNQKVPKGKNAKKNSRR